jgi:hypothetical protein
MKSSNVVKQVIAMTDSAKTFEELHQLLNSIAYTIGGMVCHFPMEDRTNVIMSLTESVGMGIMKTSKKIGEKCDIEMVVGKGKG